jgi:hypothetical protein
MTSFNRPERVSRSLWSHLGFPLKNTAPAHKPIRPLTGWFGIRLPFIFTEFCHWAASGSTCSPAHNQSNCVGFSFISFPVRCRAVETRRRRRRRRRRASMNNTRKPRASYLQPLLARRAPCLLPTQLK